MKETLLDAGLRARVVTVHKSRLVVETASGERSVSIDVRLLQGPPERRPVTGDWVVLFDDIVREVLPRTSAFIRRAAGNKAVAQVVAANIDRVLIVMALPGDINIRRLERYLALGWESGALPTVVLTKCDLVHDVEHYVASIRVNAPGVDVIAVSAANDDGVNALRALIMPGNTIALLGSSGVGKSTLLNRLAGHVIMRTADVDSDGRGRHTTTHRELVHIGDGVSVIDTPGMREMQVWSAESGLEQAFGDITALSASCRFGNCSHERERGCAVTEAVADGTLDVERLHSWRKLAREAARSILQTDAVAAAAEKARLRTFMRNVNAEVRRKRRT